MKSKIFRSFRGSKWRAVEAHSTLVSGVETQMEPWRVFTPAVADSHHFDEDPDSHKSEKSDQNRTKVKRESRIHSKVKRGIRIRVKVMRIRNPNAKSRGVTSILINAFSDPKHTAN